MPTSADITTLTKNVNTFVNSSNDFVKVSLDNFKEMDARVKKLEEAISEIKILIVTMEGSNSEKFATIKERQTITAIFQTGFATIAAVIASIFSRSK